MVIKQVTEGALVTRETASLHRGRNQTSVRGDRELCKDGLGMVPRLWELFLLKLKMMHKDGRKNSNILHLSLVVCIPEC